MAKSFIMIFTIPDSVPKLVGISEVNRVLEQLGFDKPVDSKIFVDDYAYEIHLEFKYTIKNKELLSSLNNVMVELKKYSPIVNF